MPVKRIDSKDWEVLLRKIKDGKCTPFFGAGVLWLVNVLLLFPLAGKGVFGHRLPQGALSATLFLFAAHWIFARMLQMQLDCD